MRRQPELRERRLTVPLKLQHLGDGCMVQRHARPIAKSLAELQRAVEMAPGLHGITATPEREPHALKQGGLQTLGAELLGDGRHVQRGVLERERGGPRPLPDAG